MEKIRIISLMDALFLMRFTQQFVLFYQAGVLFLSFRPPAARHIYTTEEIVQPILHKEINTEANVSVEKFLISFQ